MLSNFKIKEKTGFKKPKCEKRWLFYTRNQEKRKKRKKESNVMLQEHESEKQSVSCSVVSDSLQPHGL